MKLIINNDEEYSLALFEVICWAHFEHKKSLEDFLLEIVEEWNKQIPTKPLNE